MISSTTASIPRGAPISKRESTPRAGSSRGSTDSRRFISRCSAPSIRKRWTIRTSGPWGGYDNPYAVPNLTAEWVAVESPIHTGAWRSVEYPVNVLARECLLDEIAHKTSRDPVELRRELLTGEFPFASRKVDRARLRAVVDLAAAKSGWGAPLPPIAGRRVGRGIACNVYHGRTALAHVAEVSVGEKGDVRVHRIVCAADCGLVVNPLGLEGQVESGVAWGLSYALKSEITIERGRVVQASFRDFPVLGISEMPRVEVHTIATAARPDRLRRAAGASRSLPRSSTRSSRRPGAASTGSRSDPRTSRDDVALLFASMSATLVIPRKAQRPKDLLDRAALSVKGTTGREGRAPPLRHPENHPEDRLRINGGSRSAGCRRTGGPLGSR